MAWYIPFLIFLARVCDVSIGTVRIILVIRGNKVYAALLGFLEVVIWLYAVAAVITNIQDSIWTVIGYGGGFATGTLVGMALEERLAMGTQCIRIINTDPDLSVAQHLRESKNLVVTEVEARGRSGTHELSFLIVPRKRVPAILSAVREYAPESYITTEDVRWATGGSGLFTEPASKLPLYRRMRKFR